jgi:hypothetical protein
MVLDLQTTFAVYYRFYIASELTLIFIFEFARCFGLDMGITLDHGNGQRSGVCFFIIKEKAKLGNLVCMMER